MNIAASVDELREKGFCVLKSHFSPALIGACRDGLWPHLLSYLQTNGDQPNRGPNRHFMPMPFMEPCFQPEFFFDDDILAIARALLGNRIVADQWGCDTPVGGSRNQEVHVDYQRPLFSELPDLPLPFHMLVVSFGLIRITAAHGAIEIAPHTHLMPRDEAARAVRQGDIMLHPVPLEVGDVLVRHPWAMHRGTPNTTDTPRALVTIRYVRDWYADDSREVSAMPAALWQSLPPDRQRMLRFPRAG